MNKKIRRLKHREAISRLDEMMRLIYVDVQVALATEAALEGANETVMGELKGVQFYGADCYNAVKQSMSIFLAMTLAKLFETPSLRGEGKGTRFNKSDVASLPLMVRLLRQKRCRAELIRRAAAWTPQVPSMSERNVATCEREIDRAISAYNAMRVTHAGRMAVFRLKKFRDKVAAHTLLGPAVEIAPTYREMFFLMDVARNITQHARLAIEGIHCDLKDSEETLSEVAKAFWRPALLATARSNKPPKGT